MNLNQVKNAIVNSIEKNLHICTNLISIKEEIKKVKQTVKSTLFLLLEKILKSLKKKSHHF